MFDRTLTNEPACGCKICFEKPASDFFRALCRMHANLSSLRQQVFCCLPHSTFMSRCRVARLFLVQRTKTEKMYQNDYKIYEKVIKFINICHCKTLQNLPKLGLLVWKYSIWQPSHGVDPATASWYSAKTAADFHTLTYLLMVRLTYQIF
jgi:hypothetical protein